jgi:universal stress protein A
MPIQRVMLATDFSPHARAALRYAAELSGRLGVPLVLAHAYLVPALPLPEGAVIPSPDALAEAMARTGRELEAEKKTALELGAASVDTVVADGPAALKIVELAKDRNADLLVIGTHGRGVVARAILGSVADKVMRTAPCPVMIVHATDAG